MIIEAQKIEHQETLIGETNVRQNAQIRPDKMAKILTLLGNIYQDKYATVPLEYLSNAWDSHLEAGVPHEPIVCELKKDQNGKWYFAAIDYGVGISPDRIQNFNNYGDSTKDQDADAIGHFGLGTKSYLSYTNKLFVNTVFNGVKYTYLVCQDEYGVPGIELLGESSTTDRNGTKVWFYLLPDAQGWNSTPEYKKFYEGIKRRTSYFENLSYQLDSSLDDLNKYKIYKAKHFWYSPMKPYNELHIIIKNVPYKLDWTLLGISQIDIPIGVPVEGVYPMATREGFILNDKTQQIILDSIKKASTELVEMVNKKRTKVDNWYDWYKLERENPYVDLGGYNYDISSIRKYSEITLNEVDYAPLEGLDKKHIVNGNFLPFIINAKVTKSRRTDAKYSNSYVNQFRNGNEPIYKIEGSYSPKKNGYLNTLHSFVYMCKREKYTDKDISNLLYIREDDATFDAKKQQYLKFVDDVWLTIPSYDDLVISQEYLDSIKKNRIYKSSLKPDGEITYYLLREAEKRGDYYHALDNCSTKDFDKPFKKLVVYGNKDDRKLLDSIWRSSKRNYLECIIIADSHKKYLTHHQYIHVNDYMKTKTFSRVVTAYKIKQLLKSNSQFVPEGHINYEYRNNYFKGCSELSTEFKDLMTELNKYMDKVLYEEKWNNKLDDAWLTECVTIANEQKLWDYEVYYKIDQLESLLKRFRFIKAFRPEYNWKDLAMNYIKKVNKDVRMNLNCYQNA